MASSLVPVEMTLSSVTLSSVPAEMASSSVTSASVSVQMALSPGDFVLGACRDDFVLGTCRDGFVLSDFVLGACRDGFVLGTCWVNFKEYPHLWLCARSSEEYLYLKSTYAPVYVRSSEECLDLKMAHTTDQAPHHQQGALGVVV